MNIPQMGDQVANCLMDPHHEKNDTKTKTIFWIASTTAGFASLGLAHAISAIWRKFRRVNKNYTHELIIKLFKKNLYVPRSLFFVSFKNDVTNSEKMQQKLVMSFLDVDVLKEYKTNNPINSFKRDIKVGYNKKNNEILFIKTPTGKYIDCQEDSLKNEELSFLISTCFELNVVPTTLIMKTKEIPNFNTLFNLDSFLETTVFGTQIMEKESIVQSAVLNQENDQVHLQKDPQEKLLKEVNLNQVHKAILFNMLTGRHDGRKNNTIIDKHKKVKEIDNEVIGFRTTDSWMLNDFKSTCLKNNIIKNFLSHNQSIITTLFKIMKKKNFKFEKNIENNILYNFNKIKTLFTDRKKKAIYVYDLININASSSASSS